MSGLAPKSPEGGGLLLFGHRWPQRAGFSGATLGKGGGGGAWAIILFETAQPLKERLMAHLHSIGSCTRGVQGKATTVPVLIRVSERQQTMANPSERPQRLKIETHGVQHPFPAPTRQQYQPFGHRIWSAPPGGTCPNRGPKPRAQGFHAVTTSHKDHAT